MATLGATHKKVASDLSALLTPLGQYLDENKKTFTTKKDGIEAAWKALDKQRSELPGLETTYTMKCQAADGAEKENAALPSPKNTDGLTVPVMDVMMTIGPMEMTVEELNNTLFKLQRQVPVEVCSSSCIMYEQGELTLIAGLENVSWDTKRRF
jgi:hypothetical protein